MDHRGFGDGLPQARSERSRARSCRAGRRESRVDRRRLILEGTSGATLQRGDRLHDGRGHQVCGGANLTRTRGATSIDSRNPTQHRPHPGVRLLGAIAAIRSATNGALAWRRVEGMPQFMAHRSRPSAREVVIRWRAPACQRSWKLEARASRDATSLDLYAVEDCSGDEVTRRLVIEFYRTHDIDKFDSGFCCG